MTHHHLYHQAYLNTGGTALPAPIGVGDRRTLVTRACNSSSRSSSCGSKQLFGQTYLCTVGTAPLPVERPAEAAEEAPPLL